MSEEIIGIEAFYGAEGQGNLAGVCILREPLSDIRMQKAAKEFGASETAFVILGTTPFSLRWFSPTQEIALCGHGTLATAFYLWENNFVSKEESISFSTLSGTLNCSQLADGKIELSFPELKVEPAHIPKSILEALGITRPLFIGTSQKYILIEIESEALLRTLSPNMAALKKVMQRGFLITTRSQRAPYDFVSRCFFPKEGIPEDPVTGSAHCVLGPYWKRKLGKETLLAFQASNAGGEIEISFKAQQVFLRGLARFVLSKHTDQDVSKRVSI